MGGLTMLEIPRPDPPVAVSPPGIAPEKLRAVADAEKELAEASRLGCSPQQLSRLLDKFWAAQRAATPKPQELSIAACPNCGGPSEHIVGERPDRRRCLRCACNFSSQEKPSKVCPSCASRLTVKFSHGTHCNECGKDF